MKKESTKCLLLNADYMPLSIISWKRALIWHLKHENKSKYSIDIIDFYKNDYIVGVQNKKYPIPAVAKTNNFFNIRKKRVVFSRKNIFLRDNYSCQYCNKKFERKHLTYDHVVPKSKWKNSQQSPTNWNNIVTACTKCNRIKANRTPAEANMPLKHFPTEPNKSFRFLPVCDYLTKIKDRVPAEWIIYLPDSYLI